MRTRLLLATLALICVAVPSAFATGSEDGRDRWLLGGSARLAQDPENPINDVIRIDTRCTAPAFNCFGTVSRTVDTKIHKLDNMLEFKARFEGDAPTPKSCIGGAPRFQLAIDLNGDGTTEGNAFGYYGPPPSFAGCPMETWMYEDLTGPGDFFITGGTLFPSAPQLLPLNEETEWDLTQFVCVAPTLPPGPPNDPCIAHPGFVTNWSNVETIVGGFPNHEVCTVALVDDTFGAPAMSGLADYDIISGGRATFEDRHDIAGRGFARGCLRPDDDGDDDDDDDHDHDGDEDSDDSSYDDNRRDRWGDDSDD